MILKRLSQCCLLILTCILLSVIFGIVHNQITYSLSYEYFTLFKFPAYGIDIHGDERFYAGLVGINSSWWAGLLIGTVLSLLYFSVDVRVVRLKLIRNSLLLILFFTVIACIIASMAAPLIYEYPTPFCENNPVMDCISFNRARAIHAASYLGALSGLLIVIFQVVRTRILLMADNT